MEPGYEVTGPLQQPEKQETHLVMLGRLNWTSAKRLPRRKTRDVSS